MDTETWMNLQNEIFSLLPPDFSPKDFKSLKLDIQDILNILAKGYFYKYVENLKDKIENTITLQKSSIFATSLKVSSCFKEILTSILKGDYKFVVECKPSKFFNLMIDNYLIQDIRRNEKSISKALKHLEDILKKHDFVSSIFFIKEAALNYFCLISNLNLLQKEMAFSKTFLDESGALDKKAFDLMYADILEVSKVSNIPAVIIIIKAKNLDYVFSKYGDIAANEFLKYIISNIKKNLRQYDNIFKYKEGTFDILLVNETKKTAELIIERIRSEFLISTFKYNEVSIVPELEYQTKSI